MIFLFFSLYNRNRVLVNDLSCVSFFLRFYQEIGSKDHFDMFFLKISLLYRKTKKAILLSIVKKYICKYRADVIKTNSRTCRKIKHLDEKHFKWMHFSIQFWW